MRVFRRELGDEQAHTMMGGTLACPMRARRAPELVAGGVARIMESMWRFALPSPHRRVQGNAECGTEARLGGGPRCRACVLCLIISPPG